MPADELTHDDLERIGRAIAQFALDLIERGQRGNDWYAYADLDLSDEDEIRTDIYRAVALRDAEMIREIANAAHGYEPAIALGRECVALLKGL